MEKQIEAADLGCISLRTHPRATRYSLKITKGKIIATMPVGGDEARMLAFIRENREKLQEALRRYPASARLDEATQLQTATFRLHIFRTPRTRFYMTLDDGILHIACPSATDFEDEATQRLLKEMLEKTLRHEARRWLPGRLEALARKHGFTFTGVKINNSKTRWGSCTMKKSINLSLSLMLLPWHLIDYVLLHELCHTEEMNHGKRFWQWMARVTEGRAEGWRKELKGKQML